MATDTKESLNNVLNMDKESKNLQMEIVTKDTTKTVSQKVKDNIIGTMVVLIKDNLSKD